MFDAFSSNIVPLNPWIQIYQRDSYPDSRHMLKMWVDMWGQVEFTARPPGPEFFEETTFFLEGLFSGAMLILEGGIYLPDSEF